jgi:hypothetical protein
MPLAHEGWFKKFLDVQFRTGRYGSAKFAGAGEIYYLLLFQRLAGTNIM